MNILDYAGQCAWLRSFRRAVGFPASYLSFDLETTGLSPTKDFIIQVGYLEVIDGVPGRHGAGMLDWAGAGLADPDALRAKLERTRDQIERGGKTYRFTYGLLKDHGMPPLEVLQGFCNLVTEARQAKRPLVTHNGLSFDLKFIASHFQEYLKVAVNPGPSEVIDTMHVERAAQVGLDLGGSKSWADFYALPELRKPGTKAPAGLYEHCCPKYGLSYPGENVRDHDGLADATVTARLYEAYRKLSEDSNAEAQHPAGPAAA